ncbi:MAG: glycogen debranching protein GlgX [Spirochaetaceae bacterium]|nr:glycogen debranching protein GlgX [Spirochaetaceae bacterium]
MKQYKTSLGKAIPLGGTIVKDGVNFALFSRNATEVSLLLYDEADSLHPSSELCFNSHLNRTGDIWHILVEDLTFPIYYNYRINGPHSQHDILNGHRFDNTKQLLDPYAKAVTGGFKWDFNNNGPCPKGIILANDFDWQDDKQLRIPLHKTIIYETHLKSLTALANVKYPASYLGVTEVIPYLKELGITAIELLPVFEFNEDEYGHINPLTGEVLKNYWGYSTMSFFAPHGRYAASGQLGEQVNEFKYMVRELHKAGIEVILDVVFNHTNEGNERGPTVSFKGIDNSVYYMLYDDKRYYWNFSGCGNTFNCNHPVVAELIIDSLRYWYTEMHVDGFRFDLATIMMRDQNGHIMDKSPLVTRIGEDPVLKDCKIIAEAWDAGGGYKVGNFPHPRFAEWNDRFRDELRRYWRGDNGLSGIVATRLAGSNDLFANSGKQPFSSINFVTCHDGFTLNDLVSYKTKHNEANGQNNTDGANENYSSNYGSEGPSDDIIVNNLRQKQKRNFLVSLILAQGVPMLLAGDEIGHSQQGNNNAYCQDNEISYLSWLPNKIDQPLLRFYKALLAFKGQTAALQRQSFFLGDNCNSSRFKDIIWYNPDGSTPKWDNLTNTLSCRISGETAITGEEDTGDIAFFFNPTGKEITFILPPLRAGHHWFLKINTAENSPKDIYDGTGPIVSYSLIVKDHSAVVLQSGQND